MKARDGEAYLGHDLIPSSDKRASDGLLSTMMLRFASLSLGSLVLGFSSVAMKDDEGDKDGGWWSFW
ncbi:hypothetical protein MRB53_002794 [Persea americana]|uniref:Uncharacterized protein n=1 Tax=Persea americana TaxID=3435 RepID=A0ACC2MVR0_PERAE|nr:hypothetical protein MRB53_002794 [Persea americana]